MDLDFNAISLGVEFGQLTADEKRYLFECLGRLFPFGWTEDILHTWYTNRKLSVVRDGNMTRYYGQAPSGKWRPLLETEKKSDQNTIPTWKVGAFQWLPTDHAAALQEALKGVRK